MVRFSKSYLAGLLLLTHLYALRVKAQTATLPTSSEMAGSDATLRGVVLNAATNQPLGRSLVVFGSRSLLTTSDGKFEFTGQSGSSESLRVTKPGFYEGNEQFPVGHAVTLSKDLSSLEVRLYPEAILTGTVSAPNGDPIPQLYIQALRRVDDESGERWMMAGQTSSNADGQFRLPVVSGDYVVETRFMPEFKHQHKAVLPMMVPDSGRSGYGSSTMHLASGTGQQLDLRPPVRTSYAVHIRMDQSRTGDDQNFALLQAHLPDGLSIMLNTRPSETPGEVIATLPSGSYTISATTNQPDQSSYGETRVTVTDQDVFGVEIHRTTVLPLGVLASVDPASVNAASTSDNQLPPVQQLGIYFYRTDAGVSAINPTIYLSQARRSDAVVANLPPGHYRLRAQAAGQWFIASASVGGTDLLNEDLDVDAEESSTPLLLVLSNQTGTVKGTVKLNGQPSRCWVYLLATFPSATPILSMMSASDGTFSRANVPSGGYRMLAFEMRHTVDLENPAAVAQFAAATKSVDVTVGEAALVDIDAVPNLEIKR